MLRIFRRNQSVNLALATALVAAVVGAADNSLEALTICGQADQLAGEERTRLLDRGLALAEDAVAADRSDAKAHFAVFCNLGKKIQGADPGLRQALGVGRLRREIDSALTLAPDDPELLAAKGAFLLELPSYLGGDAEQGKALLGAALAKDPSNRAAHRYLTGQ
jgi:hypothetical protein